ncbi:peptide deformylase [Bifidobacterium margollesii]|uniref:Peptide deformylase n=1 Tax=Bifidobacterium margollesii TaxID=2020964 RepID=A0A2N5J9K2_9BIFI|nr:peptide deformylase [Bifidobacterium margollesii]PLS30851.1 peptide deformylase [Bifidobacterium margollesii]
MFGTGKSAKINMELNREVELMLKEARTENDGLLPIVQAGEPVLRHKTARYQGQLTKGTFKKLVEVMRHTMIEAPGVGLAATQIGLGLAFAVMEDHVGAEDANDPREATELPFRVVVNPVYTPVGQETRSFYEGCLSFDGYQAVRRRWLDIDAEWDDESGAHHKERMHGWAARIFQHETDHLSGELYIDKAEIRSLTTYDNLEDYWCDDPVPSLAAKELGFEL